jgi:RNA polymerase sigma-70 factor (ECF subfamily)
VTDGDDDNPLLDGSPEGWTRLVQKLGPAAMLLCIERRMGSRLREVMSAEDIWQDTLLHVWRDRGACVWHGFPALRRWVLSVAENRIRNAADRHAAHKRGGATQSPQVGAAPPPDEATHGPRPSAMDAVTWTTPSQVAVAGERLAAMRAAVDALPSDLREVLHLRLFEELTVPEVAARLGLGESAVKHRFRRAAALYEAHLRARLGER